jgi:hypothetical protein
MVDNAFYKRFAINSVGISWWIPTGACWRQKQDSPPVSSATKYKILGTIIGRSTGRNATPATRHPPDLPAPGHVTACWTLRTSYPFLVSRNEGKKRHCYFGAHVALAVFFDILGSGNELHVVKIFSTVCSSSSSVWYKVLRRINMWT